MTNRNNEKIHNEPVKKEKKFSWPRFIIGMLILMSPVAYMGYLSWQSNVTDQDNQVPITCTVSNAEQYTSSGAGKSYSSSKDYIAFDTQECRTLLLPISTDDDYQSMINEIQKGKKYEFMMGESQVDVKSGAREVFSYSGPTE